jgi:hypothetical protein
MFIYLAICSAFICIRGLIALQMIAIFKHVCQKNYFLFFLSGAFYAVSAIAVLAYKYVLFGKYINVVLLNTCLLVLALQTSKQA